ncbi:hypothetical protein [Plantibacter sp. YIM 135249]|uniref:hypothetical protein n=1 Tax=Plantibacter sp. YIM 135249 TaxID=3423918 RepID=UPI003D338EFE
MPMTRHRPHRQESSTSSADGPQRVADAGLHPGFGSAARLEPSRIGGSRLGRTLGTGPTWTAISTMSGRSSDREPVLLRPSGGAPAVLARGVASVLTALDHRHVLAVIDLAEADDGGWCLFVERLGGGNLPDLLRRRVTIAPGEAVTILAPLVDALRHAHDRGVVHGSVTAADIRFDRSGRPVLCGWGRASADAPTDPGADWRCLAAVIDAVLPAAGAEPDQTRGEQTSTAWVAEMGDVLTPEEFATAFEERVFGLARPLPVLLDADPAEVSRAAIESRGFGVPQAAHDTGRRDRRVPRTGASGRAVPASFMRLAAGVRAGCASIVRGRHDGGRPDQDARLDAECSDGRRHEPRTSSRAAAGGSEAVDAPRRSARRRVSRTRRRAVLLGVSVAVVISTAIVLALPDAGSSSAQQRPSGADASPSPTATASGPQDAGAPAGSGESDAAAPDGLVPGGSQTPGAGSLGAEDALKGDDPLAATVELLRRRSACLAAADAACLGTLSEPGSAADEADREAVAGPAEGRRAVDVEAGSVSLVGRQGDAAVCSGTAVPPAGTTERQPVTILVMRTETGWRLRELFGYGSS